MKLNHCFIGFIVFFFLMSCREAGKQKEVSEKEKLSSAINKSKADSILGHFWDNYNFTDTTSIKDPNISEQALVNFIGRFRVASESGISAAIKKMLDRAAVQQQVYDYFVEQYERYLYDPNSPMRNDLYYKLVLTELVTSSHTNQTDRVRYKARLDLVKKNMPGSEIIDFKYVSSSETHQRLHDIQASNKLLIFYDPGCPHCQEAIHELSSSYNVNDLIKQGKLKVVAICPIGSYQDWKNYQANIPTNWINGFDQEGILIRQRLYDLKAFPTLFLIDHNNRVILKDTDLQHILNFFVA